MNKKLAVITGATSGIGFALAEQLLGNGWRLVMVCRDMTKVARATAKLRKLYPASEIDIVMCDLADQDRIKSAVAEILQRFPRIDALFNNAAISLGDKQLSRHGNEMHFQTNVIAPYMLMVGLEPALSSSQGIVINTSGVIISLIRRLKIKQLVNPHKFTKFFGAYAQSKLAITTITNALAPSFAEQGIVCRSADPGPARTPLAHGEGMPMLMRPFWHFYRSPKKAASYIMDAAFSEKYERRTGIYVSQGREARPPSSTRNKDQQQALLSMLEVAAPIAF